MVLYLTLGAAAALGQAPWGLWPLTIIALAMAFALFRQSEKILNAGLLGWAVGLGYFMVALSWIVEPFMVDIARHGWMAPFALVGLSLFMASYWAIGFAAARALGGGAVALIASFTLGEALRGYLFTGFPWAQIGHVWIDTPILQWAAYVGPLGLIALTWCAAAALWHLLAGQRIAGAVVLVVVAVLYPLGASVTPTVQETKTAPTVRLIQPNAPQHEKWDPAMMPVFFNRQIDFTAAGDARPDLIVWPETAIPVLLNNAEGVLAAISDAAGDVPVVLGAQRVDGMRLYNSLAVLTGAGHVATVYDKHHLVPFGEFVPFGELLKRFGIAGLAAKDGNGFSSGPGKQVLDLGPLGRALPLICYEGVFARNVRAKAERPDFLLMITNDAWFGQVSGPYQHLAQARLRAVEQGLPMIRVANTGISAMIDPAGRITAQLSLGETGWIDVALPAPRPQTVYATYGDLPVAVILAVILAATLALGRRRKGLAPKS